jgi:hypothetical protein
MWGSATPFLQEEAGISGSRGGSAVGWKNCTKNVSVLLKQLEMITVFSEHSEFSQAELTPELTNAVIPECH